MRNLEKYQSSKGFLDLLFNMVLGLAAMFYIAFILINPPTKKSDAPKKAEFLITLDWNSTWNDDIDIWVKGPDGATVSFRKADQKYVFLERDDLGWKNDEAPDDTGKMQVVHINREVVTLRGIVPGEFKIAGHVYARKDKNSSSPGRMRITVLKLNPYEEVFTKEYEYIQSGQVITLINFTINPNGSVNNLNFNDYGIVVQPVGDNSNGQ